MSQNHTFSSSNTILHQETGSSSHTNTSPSDTIFYSLSDPEDDPVPKRQNEGEPSTSTDTRNTRKKHRIERLSNPVPIEDFVLEEPDWINHHKAWGFLQSQNPDYPSKYLEKTDPTSHRSGYLLGRKYDCDIVFHRSDISKAHCLIYMETGANQRQKGIRIFIKDTSFNGTFVDGRLVGVQKRVLLKNGNTIQLIKPPEDQSLETTRHKFYRILFPPSFEANNCESVYEFKHVLGRGNFAVVSYAINRETKEEAAIKVLNKVRFQNKPRILDSIFEEITIMMSLHEHPLLVKMKNIFNELHKIFLVLEYVPGGELYHYVVKNNRLDEDKTRFIFWQLLMAIKFLHDNNFAHRDLKPENVLLVDEETLHVKISDFGLAKTEYRDNKFGSQCGTPNYVAPEILDSSENRAYDKQCDLWSLGVILFICLSGYPPFSEESAPPSMKQQIKEGRYNFDTPQWDNISDEAKDLVTKLLTVNPKERYQAHEALTHDWMYMNEPYMEKMKQGLGQENLEAIQALSEAEPQSITQMPQSQNYM